MLLSEFNFLFLSTADIEVKGHSLQGHNNCVCVCVSEREKRRQHRKLNFFFS